MKHYYKELLHENFVQHLVENNQFIDARKGGLLLGNSHEDGGVFFIYQFPEGFRVFGEAEGWEFFLNWEASKRFSERIKEINNLPRDIYGVFNQYEIPKGTDIIDARLSKNSSKYILCDHRGGFAIINKYSTQKFLVELNEINSKGLAINNEKPYEIDGVVLENFNDQKQISVYSKLSKYLKSIFNFF